jgi:hypothetical protein
VMSVGVQVREWLVIAARGALGRAYPLENVHGSGSMQLLLSMTRTIAGMDCACLVGVFEVQDVPESPVLSRPGS